MFCIFRYLCVTVYIQLFSFRAASVCLINSVVSCQLSVCTNVIEYPARYIATAVVDRSCLSNQSNHALNQFDSLASSLSTRQLALSALQLAFSEALNPLRND